MVEPYIENLINWNNVWPRRDTELLKVYLEINLHGFDEEVNEGSSGAWDRHKDALLPILVKDALGGCDQVQKLALEFLGHLAAMAEDMSPFELQQAMSLWSTVARVLHDEAPRKLSKIMALYAIVNETMGPSIMEPSAPLLTSAIAKAMRHESAQARKHAAAAAFRLLGDAPIAMKQSAPVRTVATMEDEGEMWVPCLLRLCLDDCNGVRAEALKAAKRAVSCIKRDGTIASWVLGRVKDSSLFQDMDRVLRHREASFTDIDVGATTRSTPRDVDQLKAPQPSPIASKRRRSLNGSQAINAERVKHAMMAWAVHLSLADFDRLEKCRDLPGNANNVFRACTDKFFSASAKFNHSRSSVRVEAVEAWGMFASTCLSNVTRHQAAKVTELALRPMTRSVLKDREPVVREAAYSQLARCMASFPPHSVKNSWRLPDKLERAGKVGLADFLRRASGGERAIDIRHFCARMLSAVLPCSVPAPTGSTLPCSLQRAGLALAVELSPILSTLQNLMQAFPPPDLEISVSSITASATPLDALPTWSLIARAWCGLVLWAVSERCTGGVDGASTTDGSNRELGNGEIKTMSRLLRWLLFGETSREDSVEPSAASNSMTTPSSDGPASAIDKASSARNSTGDLTEWKWALLVAFVRVLSNLRGSRGGVEDCRVEEWMKLPVEVSKAFLEARPEVKRSERAESISWDCAECAAARDVQASVLKDLGDIDNPSADVTTASRERAGKRPAASAVPLWVALVVGVLGGRCHQHASECQLQPEKSTGRSRDHGDTISCGSRTSAESILTQVLTLSPPGGPARLLSSLARGMDPPSTGQAKVDVDEETRKRLTRSLRCFLAALGRAWCAEAVRNVLRWKSLGTPSVEGDSSVCGAFDDRVHLGRGHGRSDSTDALANVEDQQRPNAELLESTAHALRTVPKSAVRFLRSPFSHAKAMEETHDPGKRKAANDVELFGKNEPSPDQRRRSPTPAECDLDAGLRRDSRVHHSSVEAAFGARIGKLWRALFATRRRHSAGLPGLMKKLTRDCAALTFSSGPDGPRQAAVGSSIQGKTTGATTELTPDVEGKSEAWGFVISQSQSTSQDRRGKTRTNGALGQAKSSSKDSSGGLNGTELLSRPPPLVLLPIVTAAAQALLEFVVTFDAMEPDSTRKRALGTALAMLAWALTSPSTAQLPLSSTSEVLVCLRALRRTDASGKKIARRELVFPLNEVSLVPVSRLVAVGLRQSFATQSEISSAGLQSAEICVAASPALREEILEVAMCVLAGVKGFRRNLLASPGVLRTLTPMLEAVLEMPISSETNHVQSTLIDTWNHTFGILPGGREWQSSFPPTLRCHLERLAGLAEVKMPPGMAFKAIPERSMPDHGREAGGSEGVENEDAARLRMRQGHDPGGGSRCSSTPFGDGGGVAGALSAAGAARSFIRQGRGCSTSVDTPTAKKRPLSPANDASPTAVGSTFIRVVGSGRGSGRRQSKKRAAVITHTSLDGSQAPWEDGSQLPDTEPDSVPEPPLPSPPKYMAPSSTSATESLETARPGKRSFELDSVGDLSGSSRSIRRVRLKSDVAVASPESESGLGEDDVHNDEDVMNSEDQRMAATMAAIAKESSASTAEGNQRDTASLEGKMDTGCDNSRTSTTNVKQVADVAEELAKSLELATQSMKVDELEEVHSLLSQALRLVRQSQGGQ